MSIEELYKLGHLIPESLKNKNKYTWLAYNNLIEIKYLDVNDIFKHKTPINNFVVEHGSVLLIPNIINGKLADLTIKALNSKHILKFNNVNLPYNIGNLENFRYGDPLIIVEGIADVGGFKLIDPKIPVVALRTNSISKDAYKVYESITNNIILLLDNDKAGNTQIAKLQLKLKEIGIHSTVVNQYNTIKDTGDIADLFMQYEKTKDKAILSELNNINIYYKAQINLIKTA